ncbi:hypothetical protein IEN85_13375 [Pelagicoccus sp. NFK12]|uniref:Flagellar basal-body/hook protein C-terminal domain-containing protein n=1 Tax=Pelagicoccus enzymogenes TaxID=2773457 RepID=A0A927FB52_9BACT|nr:hypothetical protein [Pelagicoccus enzymogenes]MBD5780485.1 hypothetical protein [Pelagicoccus enzymogenes]MDQ8197615.1 hypothetical protein [Pelagicoccus enzymogenes]
MAIRPVTTSASTIFDKAREGMGKGERKLNKAAAKVASGDFGPNPILEMAKAEAMYGANARVIQAHHEMLGTVLDTRS